MITKNPELDATMREKFHKISITDERSLSQAKASRLRTDGRATALLDILEETARLKPVDK